MSVIFTITGPIGSISESRTTQKGKTFIWISVTENISKDETLWHRFFVWNKQAEKAQTHLRPGSIVEAQCHVNVKDADKGLRQTIFTAYRLTYLANFGKSKSNQPDGNEDLPFLIKWAPGRRPFFAFLEACFEPQIQSYMTVLPGSGFQIEIVVGSFRRPNS